MSSPTVPCTNANPDIAGIGVRVSVYIQAFLNLACAIIFARDGSISSYEGALLSTTSTNLFLTGCVLLVSTFIQKASAAMTIYHTLIVLNLSWIISLSALLFVIFITLSPVLNALRFGSVNGALLMPSSSKYVAPVLLSVFHLCAIGALGIRVWTKMPTSIDQRDCEAGTFLTVFGQNIPVTSGSLRNGSIALYSLMVIPFLNILLFVVVMAIFLTMIHLCSIRCRPNSILLLTGGALIAVLLEILFVVDTELLIERTSPWVKGDESRWTFGQILAMSMVILPVIETAKAVRKGWENERRSQTLYTEGSVYSQSEDGSPSDEGPAHMHLGDASAPGLSHVPDGDFRLHYVKGA